MSFCVALTFQPCPSSGSRSGWVQASLQHDEVVSIEYLVWDHCGNFLACRSSHTARIHPPKAVMAWWDTGEKRQVTERAHEGLENMMEHCMKTDKEIRTSFPLRASFVGCPLQCCRNAPLHVIPFCLWYCSRHIAYSIY
jgi:hypothetical protein